MKVSTILATITAAIAGVSAAPAGQPAPVVADPNGELFSLMIVNRQKHFDGQFLTLEYNRHDGIYMIKPSTIGFDRFGIQGGSLFEVNPVTNEKIHSGFNQWTESGGVRPYAFSQDGPQVFTFTTGMEFTNDGMLRIAGKSKWALCTFRDATGQEYGKVLSWLEFPLVDPFRKCDNIEVRRV